MEAVMEIGIDNFVGMVEDPRTAQQFAPQERMRQFLHEVQTADVSGVDTFGVGEHHRESYMDSAPAVILAAAAARTERIKLRSAVTVLSADDPVRVFESFATLDLISNGRAEMVVGRGSFTEAFPLFGLDLSEYDSLFDEKLRLLLQLREETHPHWSGRHRAPLTGQGVFPRPVQSPLPVWIGVGGTPASFIRAGELGLPLMIAIIGGKPSRFRPLIDLYREVGARAGHSADDLKVGVHAFGFVAPTDQEARDAFWPGYERTFTLMAQERGFRPPSRRDYEASIAPGGPYAIGAPDTVAAKIREYSETLGGLDRFTMQMTSLVMRPEAMIEGITLLGSEVMPQVG